MHFLVFFGLVFTIFNLLFTLLDYEASVANHAHGPVLLVADGEHQPLLLEQIYLFGPALYRSVLELLGATEAAKHVGVHVSANHFAIELGVKHIAL